MDSKTPPNTYTYDQVPPAPLRKLKFNMKTVSKEKRPLAKMPRLMSMKSISGEVEAASASLVADDGEIEWQDGQSMSQIESQEVRCIQFCSFIRSIFLNVFVKMICTSVP